MNRSNTDANRFRLPPGARPVACVDIGGTKVAVSIADEHGLRARVEEPTAKSGSNSALADQLMRKNGNAGHGGRMFVSDNDDALCGCGNVGDLEALVAGNVIPRRFSETGFFDGAKLLTAAKDNHPQALTIVDELCLLKGCALYNLITTLDLQRISLGGSGYWHHRDFLLPRLRQHVVDKMPALTQGCELVSAGLGGRVGDSAAFALVADL